MAGKLATNDARAELISLVKELALQFGDFTLASGKKASFYLDCRKVSLHGRGARLIGELMLEELAGDLPDAVGGMAIGADPITAAIITLALHSLGHEDNTLYDGSWSEWGGRDDTPAVTGKD